MSQCCRTCVQVHSSPGHLGVRNKSCKALDGSVSFPARHLGRSEEDLATFRDGRYTTCPPSACRHFHRSAQSHRDCAGGADAAAAAYAYGTVLGGNRGQVILFAYTVHSVLTGRAGCLSRVTELLCCVFGKNSKLHFAASYVTKEDTWCTARSCVVPWIPDHGAQPANLPTEIAELRRMVAELHKRCLSNGEFIAAIEHQARCLTPTQVEQLQVLACAILLPPCCV